MTTHDPLDLFRRALASSLTPVLLTAASEPASNLADASYVSFPPQGESGESTNIAKDASTRYTSKADSRDEFYNIGQLWLAWSERDSGVREYLVKGQQGGLGYVGIADRRGVVEYLTGSSGAGGDDDSAGGRVVPKGDQQGKMRRCISLSNSQDLVS